MSANQVEKVTEDIQIRLPSSLKEKLENKAKSDYRSQSSICREAIARFFENDS